MIRFAYGLAAVVFIVDQLVKYAIVHVLRLPEQGMIGLLPVFSLTWVENRGVSMGLLTADSDAGRWLLVGMTAVIAAIVAGWVWKSRGWLESMALGLILGGALGNILDRVRLGYVADFVHLHWGRWSFYVFNVADAAITIGVAMLLLHALTARSDGEPERKTDA